MAVLSPRPPHPSLYSLTQPFACLRPMVGRPFLFWLEPEVLDEHTLMQRASSVTSHPAKGALLRQVRPGPVRSGQVRPGQVRSRWVRSVQFRSRQARSRQARPGQVGSGQVKPPPPPQPLISPWQSPRTGSVMSNVRSGQVKWAHLSLAISSQSPPTGIAPGRLLQHAPPSVRLAHGHVDR